MHINFKAILSLFVIFAIVGLLLFTPKGQKITGNYTKPVGSFLKTMTGKITKGKSITNIGKFDISLTGVNPSSLNDLEIPVNGNGFQGRLNYEVLSVLNSGIKFDDREIDMKVEGLIGVITFFRNGNIKIDGKTTFLKLNSMEIVNPDIDLLVVGEPISYEVKDVKKDELVLSSVSGSLRCSQLTGGSLMLSGDQLELINFAGDIEQVNNSLTVTGQVDKMKLNGIDISKN